MLHVPAMMWFQGGEINHRSSPLRVAIFKATPWQQVAHEDVSADGIAEQVFVKPAAITPQTSFNDTALSANARPISALLIAQEGAHGLWTMLAVDIRGIVAGDQRLADFLNDADDGISNPAGFLFALDSGSSTLINLLPLNADGTAHGPVLGINVKDSRLQIAAPACALYSNVESNLRGYLKSSRKAAKPAKNEPHEAALGGLYVFA